MVSPLLSTYFVGYFWFFKNFHSISSFQFPREPRKPTPTYAFLSLVSRGIKLRECLIIGIFSFNGFSTKSLQPPGTLLIRSINDGPLLFHLRIKLFWGVSVLNTDLVSLEFMKRFRYNHSDPHPHWRGLLTICYTRLKVLNFEKPSNKTISLSDCYLISYLDFVLRKRSKKVF